MFEIIYINLASGLKITEHEFKRRARKRIDFLLDHEDEFTLVSYRKLSWKEFYTYLKR